MKMLNQKNYRLSALFTVLLLSLNACTPAPDTTSADNINDASDTKVKIDERMATDITPSGSFTTNSLNNIKIGDTFDPKLFTQNTEKLDDCFSAQSSEHPIADYIIIDNKVVEIGTADEDISSAYGVKVGDSLDLLYAKHDGQSPEVTDSPYGSPNENIILYYWHDQSTNNERLGTKYEVDNDVITSISIGFESALRRGEGCA